MKANELMQGDIVLYEYDGQKFPARVIEIYRNSVLVESINGEYEPIEIEEDKIFPVSLTLEILEKNGFTFEASCNLSDVSNWWHLRINNKVVFMMNKNYKFPISSNVVRIYHVHELQHCLKLVGIEKDIIL